MDTVHNPFLFWLVLIVDFSIVRSTHVGQAGKERAITQKIQYPIMKNSRTPRVVVAFALFVFSLCSPLQAQPVLTTNAPTMGTFFLLSVASSPPFPFDPYFGTLPVYAYDGVFFVDDTQLLIEGGGGMTMNSLTPPGITGTNDPPPAPVTNICWSLTNFTLGYQSSSSSLTLGIAATTNPWISLTILTTNTSTNVDLFGTTNMAPLAMPSFSKTNWIWLVRATGGTNNFSWGETNWCERYFRLGETNDSDGDWLSDIYESIVSHTRTNKWDTDDDGLSDWWELQIGLNPLLNESAQNGLRVNYVYDGAGRLKQVSGKRTETIGVDAEGNVTLSQ